MSKKETDVEKFERIADENGIPRKYIPAAKKGHNRVGGVAVDWLKSIISRVERLEQEKAEITADIRDVFAEAKGNGFDVKAIRQIIKLRKQDAQEREEEETVLDTYLRALGMIPQLELDFDESEEL